MKVPSEPYRSAQLPADARVRDLLGRMTLEEKFWQLYMSPGSRDDPTHGLLYITDAVEPPLPLDIALFSA